jgi:hypothetical protein
MFRASAILALAPTTAGAGDLLAVRVGRAETISQGTIEHALVLVESGKIVAVGEDLPIERGIPVVEMPDWVVTPGLVDCYSRLGLDSSAGGDFDPDVRVSRELYPRQELWRKALEAGVTTIGLYPPGSGIPGQAVAIRPHGDTPGEMILSDPAYLKVFLFSNAGSKKMLRDAFEKVDEYEEKVAKAKEKFDKEQESKKKKSKKDDEKKEEPKEGESTASTSDEKKDEKSDDGFVPPEPDAKVKPFVDLRAGRLAALVRINKSSDFLHLKDVLQDETITYHLRCPLRDDVDLFHVVAEIGEKKLLIVLDPRVTLQPNTRRERNLPSELARAGARVSLVPESDNVPGFESWMKDVGELVRWGMDRQAALAAVTTHPAQVLGLGERLGTIDAGKDANLVFWNGDPFEPGTEVQAVMLEGHFVYGDPLR